MSIRENSKLTIVGAGAGGTSVAYAALIRGTARIAHTRFSEHEHGLLEHSPRALADVTEGLRR
jgi:hypothetical protein